jgi:hypothetical protein
MKWIVATVTAAVALAFLSLSAPSLITSKAYASKLNGKPYGAHARTRTAACFNHACRKKK